MRQMLVVTILLCLLAIPAALLSSWAPRPQHATAAIEPPRRGFIPDMLAHPKPVIDINSAAAQTRLVTLVQWFAIAAANLRTLGPQSNNPVSWVTATPKAVTRTAAALLHSVGIAPAQAQPSVVGSVASGMPVVVGNTIGREPRDQNYASAANWYSLSADPADADARYAMGMNYLTGNDVVQDDGLAARWLMGSAERGHARAALALADLYVEGRGLERNYAAAYMWCEIAARGLANDGSRTAALAKRDRIAAAMTAEERKIAEAAIQSWKPPAPPLKEAACGTMCPER
ncbi:hypothetical protein BH10PSE9_BH10PSE9_09810 [soil metagenome]